MAALCRNWRKPAILALAAALVAVGAAAGRGFAATQRYPRDEIEAAFLSRFASFVNWPRGALDPAEFTVAVLDDDAVASDLERMLPRGEPKGRQVRVKRITSTKQLGAAQILYLGASDASILRRRLALIAGRPPYWS